ncbi:MAG: DUF6265 family protein, partial [Pseudomonadota bacterium]|nr:DUF6265 family protein [Pseudomonadota bacterium]
AQPGSPPPRAQIADLSWLAGAWEGEGITGPAREVYSPPMGGQIIGHFIQTRGNGIWFSEILSIAEANGSLEYRLKHFNADLTGWEERAEVRRFPLVAVEGDAWFLDGLTILRNGSDGMVGAVRIDNGNGTSREVVFRYRRTP